MKAFALCAVLAAFSVAAVAADKVEAKKAVQMTEAQMARVTGAGSPGLFINGNGDLKVAKSCSFSMNGNGSYWYTCI